MFKSLLDFPVVLHEVKGENSEARYLATKFVSFESCLPFLQDQCFVHPDFPVLAYMGYNNGIIRLVSVHLYKLSDFPNALVIDKYQTAKIEKNGRWIII